MKKILLPFLVLLGISTTSKLSSQTVVFEDSFESYTDFAITGVGNWTLRDVDAKTTYGFNGVTFPNSEVAKSFQVFNSTMTTPTLTPSNLSNWTARTGNKMMVSFAATSSPWNNDWIISPKISLPAGSNKVSFFAKNCDFTYGAEKYRVYVSTTGTQVADFTPISDVITTPNDMVWREFTYTLTQYAGQDVYIAIQCTSQDQFGFAIDDFTVTNSPPSTTAPICVTNMTPANGATNISVAPTLGWSESNGATSYDVYFGNSASSLTLLGNTSTLSYSITSTLALNTTYYYKIVAKNAVGEAVGCETNSFTTVAQLTYCGPLTFNYIEPITNVTFGTINNTTSASTTSPAHEFFLDKIAEVEPGQSYPISLQGNTGGNYVNRFYIFIDWNGDGDWNDEGEKYIPTGTLENSNGIDGKKVTMDIVVPANVTPGQKRMRVKKTYGSTTHDNPCTNGSTFGQAEDYTIVVPTPLEYCGPLPFSNVEPITNVTFEGINNTTSASTTSPAHEFFLDQTATVTQGQTYTMSLEGNTDGPYSTRFYIWMDWNRDGDFDDNGEFYGPSDVLAGSTGQDGKKVEVSITVPFGATPGTTRMRVKKTFGAAGTHTNPCVAGTSFGQAEDYSIKVIQAVPCTGAPTAGTASSSSSTACYAVPITLTSNTTPTAAYSYQWMSSVDNGSTWTPLGAAQTTTEYIVSSQSVTTQYKLIVTCTASSQSAETNVITITQNAPDECYCEVAADCTDGDVITNVTFAGINNTTSCSPNGYGDYRSMIAYVNAGESYPISVKVGTGWFERVSAWIDWGNDGSFDSSDFLGEIGNGTNTGETLTGTISIPEGTAAGTYRLRILAAATGSSNPASEDPCINDSEYYGEYEEYTVNVTTMGTAEVSRVKINAYPNPVVDVLNIDATSKISKITVYDASGKSTANFKANASKTSVDLSRLPSGAYVVSAETEEGVKTFKVIKK